MTEYLLLLGFHILFLKSRNKVILLISFLLLFFVMGWRDQSLGTDALNYQFQLELVAARAAINVEPLWYLINYLVSRFFNADFQIVIIFSALLTLIPLYLTILKSKINYPIFAVFLFLALYYYFYGFNVIRQIIAVTWMLYALTMYVYATRRNLLFFLIFISVAIMFHFSAMVGILFVISPALLRVVKDGIVLVQFLTFIVGFFFITPLFSFLTRFFYSEYSSYGTSNLLGNFLLLLFYNIVFIVISNIRKTRDTLFYWYYLFIIMVNVFIRAPFGNRIILLFGIVQILVLPIFYYSNNLEHKYRELYLIGIVVYSLILFSLLLGQGGIVPYVNSLY